MPDRAEVARLRAGIAADIERLLPRCHALEEALPAQSLLHRGYAGSKLQRPFDLLLSPAATPPPATAHLVDPPPAVCHRGAEASRTTLDEVLRRARHIVCVGAATDLALRRALDDAPGAVTILVPGEGILAATPGGRSRPAAHSFAAWQAVQEEAGREAVGAFVLTRHAGRADVALLRHRVHPHQRVLVEAGSPALTWLLAQWNGTVTRHGEVFVFAEPASHFREPGARFRMALDADWPRISVVTVSYNQRQYLEKCLRSVLDQRYPNLEYIVVDAGSTDGSVDLLRQYEHSFARLIIEPDEGQSDGLNKGFRHATGDILTWINSDDMLAPLSLKRAALALRETGADLVAGTCKRIAGDGTLLYKHHSALPTLRRERFALGGPLDWCNAWEKGDYFFQPEVFFTRQIWQRAGGYLKLHLFWAMDWELWLRCALAGATIVRIPDVLGISREHAAQKTTSAEMYLWQIVGILREYDELLAAWQKASA